MSHGVSYAVVAQTQKTYYDRSHDLDLENARKQRRVSKVTGKEVILLKGCGLSENC